MLRCSLLIACLLSLALAPIARASWQYVPDEVLIDQADLIVVGEVTDYASNQFTMGSVKLDGLKLAVSRVLKNVHAKDGQAVEHVWLAQWSATDPGGRKSVTITHRPGQQGVWLLRKDSRLDGVYRADRYPTLLRPLAKLAAVEALVARRAALPSGPAASGLAVRTEVLERTAAPRSGRPARSWTEVRVSVKNVGTTPITLDGGQLTLRWIGPDDAPREYRQDDRGKRTARPVVLAPGAVRFFRNYTFHHASGPHARNLLDAGKHRLTFAYERGAGAQAEGSRPWSGKAVGLPVTIAP